MTTIEMPHSAVAISSEDRYCRILVSFFVFAAKVVLECARAGAQETQSVPASCASVASESRQVRRCDDGKVDVLREVMRNAINTVDPRRAHWTWLRLFFAVHEVIKNDRPIRSGEQLAEAYSSDRRISCIEPCGHFLKRIVLHGRTLRKHSPQFRDSLSLIP